MRPSLLLIVPLLLPAAHVVAQPTEDEKKLGDFINEYHRSPSPDRVPEMLRLALKSAAVEKPDDRNLISAHAFGLMARGNAKLVRLYESEFVAGTVADQLFLLSSLQVCGDEKTVKQLGAWKTDRHCLARQLAS